MIDWALPARGCVRVTCVDEDGFEQSEVVGPDDYCLVTTGRLHLAGVQAFANGTRQLTLKLAEAAEVVE